MGLFSWIFGEGKGSKQVNNNFQRQNNQKNRIKFRPELVKNLTHDHQEIITLYGEISDLVNQHKYGHVGDKVTEFKRKLQAHVIVENVQFYTYLEHKLSDDATNLEFIQDVRKEMNGIAHAVVQFSKKYEKAHFSDKLKDEFISDLEAIGKVLSQRVAMEESQLYTLYEA